MTVASGKYNKDQYPSTCKAFSAVLTASIGAGAGVATARMGRAATAMMAENFMIDE